MIWSCWFEIVEWSANSTWACFGTKWGISDQDRLFKMGILKWPPAPDLSAFGLHMSAHPWKHFFSLNSLISIQVSVFQKCPLLESEKYVVAEYYYWFWQTTCLIIIENENKQKLFFVNWSYNPILFAVKHSDLDFPFMASDPLYERDNCCCTSEMILWQSNCYLFDKKIYRFHTKTLLAQIGISQTMKNEIETDLSEKKS